MSPKKSYNLTDLEMPAFEDIPDATVQAAMRPMLKAVAARARELAPDSGRSHKKKLNKGIRTRVRKKGLEGVVASTAPHSYLVHQGTKAHTIEAKPGRVMVFKSHGRLVRSRSVHHPGAKGQPFLTDALDQSQAEMRRILDEAGQEGIEAVV